MGEQHIPPVGVGTSGQQDRNMDHPTRRSTGAGSLQASVCGQKPPKHSPAWLGICNGLLWATFPTRDETKLVLDNKPGEYWPALVERLRRCATSTTRVRTAISNTYAEMNETPHYRPSDTPTSVDNYPSPGRENTEPPLVSAVRQTTLQSLDACDVLAREIAHYAELTGAPIKQFERSLGTIQESTQQIRATLDGLLWVYPDGAPPRGWNPYYLNGR